jgi:hypothetical protein
MLVLYIYDVKAKDKKSFNRAKRLFYYHLNRLPLPRELWKTKSVLAVPPKREKTMDSFFRRFGKSVIAYKSYSESVERI